MRLQLSFLLAASKSAPILLKSVIVYKEILMTGNPEAEVSRLFSLPISSFITCLSLRFPFPNKVSSYRFYTSSPLLINRRAFTGLQHHYLCQVASKRSYGWSPVPASVAGIPFSLHSPGKMGKKQHGYPPSFLPQTLCPSPIQEKNSWELDQAVAYLMKHSSPVHSGSFSGCSYTSRNISWVLIISQSIFNFRISLNYIK